MAGPRIDFGLQIFLVIVAIPLFHHHEFYLPGSGSPVFGGKSARTDRNTKRGTDHGSQDGRYAMFKQNEDRQYN